MISQRYNPVPPILTGWGETRREGEIGQVISLRYNPVPPIPIGWGEAGGRGETGQVISLRCNPVFLLLSQGTQMSYELCVCH